ncbi:dihydropteroate synthase [Cryptococcus neoformans var. grubii Br795]|nr:dihydropteroate synthase [Cryptococcus neoformans var. grubii AD1-83a]OWZ55687.1 dihydropteroate synthase [Cryptococcus neoformans var. grubii 125.91]OXG64717.1 dihydropteroate synthase [Cryptococcus neoformans var. grubii MW-RSA1955]OXG67061.1 dihydropteroate synthase [Cryptococcus neoformans var. grubii c8]OXG69866.1 dihydropteroate synthase [Cryptococcus neoformans var. grubii CHC193]OXG84912.1 dihydropteroate synthase [Cryptococcus neoformans var. grubii MW-RSA36]OXG86756.1 dihydropter
MPPDTITISSLTLHLQHGLGPSAFHLTPSPPCPALLSLTIHLVPNSVSATAAGDSMAGLRVNYSSVSKAVYALVNDAEKVWNGPWELMHAVSAIPLGFDDVQSVDIRLGLPKALLHALEAVYKASYTKYGEETDRNCTIRDLKVVCIVGLHEHERKEKQRLELDVKVREADWNVWGHKGFADEVYDFVSNSAYGTLESLNHELGQHLLKSRYLGDSTQSHLEITIRKPSAIPFATPSITIHRSQADYTPTLPSGSARNAQREALERVFVAIGSNIGDRVANITKAVRLLEEAGCKVLDTSRLYESEPMYVEDQDRFVNGVIELATSLEPLEVLRLLKQIEKAVGRTKTFTNGPRVIDLDLVFYGHRVVKIGNETDEEDEYGIKWLECPHKRLREREFVLRPLADIDPEFTHPALRRSVGQLLASLPTTFPPSLSPIIPLHSHVSPLRLSIPASPYIMAIFNTTPDSFSDGDLTRTEVVYALAACEKLLKGPEPPAILDIGGMSTRPGSEPCSEEDELSRVIPLVKAIRSSSDPIVASIPISIDTYRPSVAKAAVEAGASIINDVRGGQEPGMLRVMAEADVPVVLMHSRGDSKTMITADVQNYDSHGGIIKGVIQEMRVLVEQALESGVKRWNIILDPGLGFAKSSSQSLTLLKHLPDIVLPGTGLERLPMLVGASRKGFVGQAIKRAVPKERSFGDAAVSSWCASSGVVDILRVHEPREMGEVVKMACAIRDAE